MASKEFIDFWDCRIAARGDFIGNDLTCELILAGGTKLEMKWNERRARRFKDIRFHSEILFLYLGVWFVRKIH